MLEESIQMLERKVNSSIVHNYQWVNRVHRIIRNLCAYASKEKTPLGYLEREVIPLLEDARTRLNPHHSGDNSSHLNITEEIEKLRNPLRNRNH